VSSEIGLDANRLLGLAAVLAIQMAPAWQEITSRAAQKSLARKVLRESCGNRRSMKAALPAADWDCINGCQYPRSQRMSIFMVQIPLSMFV